MLYYISIELFMIYSLYFVSCNLFVGGIIKKMILYDIVFTNQMIFWEKYIILIKFFKINQI